MAAAGQEREALFHLVGQAGTAAAQQGAQPAMELEFLPVAADEIEDRADRLPCVPPEAAAQLLEEQVSAPMKN